jgi:hypothetical protein
MNSPPGALEDLHGALNTYSEAMEVHPGALEAYP